MKKTITMLILLCVAAFAQQNGSFTDTRDKKTYKTVKIGTQTWMAENLNYAAKNSKCYDNKPANCNKYGRLYNWETAKTACPSGWHLPSYKEWELLTNFAGGETAGTALKSKSGWDNNGNVTDKFSFSALPSGYYEFGCEPEGCNGSFNYAGNNGYWWSSTKHDSGPYNLRMNYDEHTYGEDTYYDEYNGSLFSVRCVED